MSVFFKYLLVTGLLMTIHLSGADLISLESYLSRNPLAEIVRNGEFEHGSAGWIIPRSYTVIQEANSRSAVLRYQRDNVRDYALATQTLPLKPGRTYRLSGKIRTEKLAGDFRRSGGGGTLCLMYSDARGGYIGGNYPEGDISGDGQWHTLTQIVNIPETCASVQLAAYLRKGVTGTVWFDNISVCEMPYAAMYPVAPSAQAVFADRPQLELHVDISPAAAALFQGVALQCRAELTLPDGTMENRTFPVRNNRVVADFQGLSLRNYPVSWSLIAFEKKVRLYSFRSNLTILPANARDKANACWIDRNGTARIAGNRKFMPIGFFMSNLPRQDVDRIAAAGVFNTLLPYASTALSLDSDGRYYKPQNANFESIEKTLDYCHSKQLRVIFSLKDFYPWATSNWGNYRKSDEIVDGFVTRLKNHPALLAWYTVDETPLENLPQLTARRNQVNRLDPHHPTWGVMNQFASLPFYSPALGITGIDPYPIRSKTSNDMNRVTLFCRQAEVTRLPLWVAPQVHDLGIYMEPDKPEAWKRFRSPSGEEIRGMTLQMANFGAKGFLFWSYYNLYRPPFKNQKDFDTSFAAICKTAALLKELQPFLLSDRPAEPLILEKNKGEFTAKVYTADTDPVRKAVIITANGPGESLATFTLDGKYSSRYGNTVQLPDGRYRFTGMDISSDVLFKDESR